MIYSNPEHQQVEWEDEGGNFFALPVSDLTPEQLAAVEPYENKAIYAQLRRLDLKSIRAIRENDTVRIAAIEAQAALLRSQLK